MEKEKKKVWSSHCLQVCVTKGSSEDSVFTHAGGGEPFLKFLQESCRHVNHFKYAPELIK